MNIYPMYKPIYPFYKIGKDIIRLGEPGQDNWDIEDNNGSIYKLLNLMDGKKSIEEIYELIKIDFPNILFSEIVEAVEYFDEIGFLYDQRLNQQVNLEQQKRERYRSNINYFSFFSDLSTPPSIFQKRLNDAHVTILGMGAFGCNILFNLAGLGVEHIRIVDFDIVEVSNLNRQMLFNEKDIGKSKIQAAKEFISYFNSNIEIETIHKQISSAEDVENLINGTDVVAVAVDQPLVIVQRWINKSCVKLGVPFFGGGMNLMTGMAFGVIPNKTGCLDCFNYLQTINMSNESFFAVENFVNSKFIPPSNTIAPVLSSITSLISLDIMNCLTHMDEMILPGKNIRFNLRTLKMDVENEFLRDEINCPTCGLGKGEEKVFKFLNDLEKNIPSIVRR